LRAKVGRCLSNVSCASSELEAEHEDARRKILEDAQIRFEVPLFPSFFDIHPYLQQSYSNQPDDPQLLELWVNPRHSNL
jgi:hypothetical protein